VPEDKGTTVTKEFPVGEDGSKFLERLAPLKALRDLGVPTDAQKADWGLADAKDRLTVTFKSGARELLLGARVFGGSDRYVLERMNG